MRHAPDLPRTALVLSGGGARGAYVAGVVHYLRTGLPAELAESPLFRMYSGTSVGAINTAFMASTAHDPVYQGVQLRRLWRDLTDEDIYRTDAYALLGFLIKTGFFTATNFLGLYRVIEARQGAVTTFPFKGVLDTTPFVHYLRRNVLWRELHRNVERRLLEGVTITATQMNSGWPTVFVEKHPEAHALAPEALPVYGPLSPKHVLGSAAIPIVFPLIRINQQYYADGSLRQNTPLTPAIHLGAEKVLIVSLHRPRAGPEPAPSLSTAALMEPTLGDISGQLLNSLFLDKLDYDLAHLQWTNHLIRDLETVYGREVVEQINTLRADLRARGRPARSLRRVVPFVIHPSEDIGRLAASRLERVLRRGRRLSPLQRFFQKVVEGSPTGQNDFVSYLLFEREYLETLIELGYEDARRLHDHLVRFFTEPVTPP